MFNKIDKLIEEASKKIKEANKQIAADRDVKSAGRKELNADLSGKEAIKEVAKDPDHQEHPALEKTKSLEEAVHENHPDLNKNLLGTKNFETGLDSIKTRRDYLARKLREMREVRDYNRKKPDIKSQQDANLVDNGAKAISQLGAVDSLFFQTTPEYKNLKEYKDLNKKQSFLRRTFVPGKFNAIKEMRQRPRIISPAGVNNP